MDGSLGALVLRCSTQNRPSLLPVFLKEGLPLTRSAACGRRRAGEEVDGLFMKRARILSASGRKVSPWGCTRCSQLLHFAVEPASAAWRGVVAASSTTPDLPTTHVM